MQDEPRTFSLIRGGPTYRLAARLGLLNRDGFLRGSWLALIAWLPLAVGEGVRVAFGMRLDPTLFDLSVHVRLVFAIPLMLLAERLIEPACASAIRSMYVGKLCERTALDCIVDRGEHLRDARLPEGAILAIAVAGGQLALWHVTGASGVFSGASGVGPWSFPHVWYVALALPLTQFVMLRWMWRWAIWSYMLARIAHLPLAALATHPDRAGGLAALARPVSGFSGYALALGAILAGAWGSQLIAGTATPKDLVPEIAVYLVAIIAVAVAPLLLFCGHLYRLRRRGLAQYGDFAVEYVRDFHDKWIDPRTARESPLGTSDLQSLADLGNSYTVVNTTRLFVFGLRSVLAVWFAALLPMLPLFASLWTFETLVRKIVGVVFGGLPL